MSEAVQTPLGSTRYRGRVGGPGLELLLYGLNEAGEPAFAERLPAHVRPRLHDIASDHLTRHHAIEVWEGPTCILRLRRLQPDPNQL